jgi:hypothetical protein
MSMEDFLSNSLLHQQIQNERSLGIAKTQLITAKTEGLGLAQVENIRLKLELDAARLALREAQEITKEWQSAMEAWRDLAQTLRDEVKSCPNHEAHKFGKNDDARSKHRKGFEDEARLKRGLQPHFRADQK